MNNKNPENRLRQWREARGMKQTELAARAGVGLSTLNRIERWHFPVSAATATCLAETLGCEVCDVFPTMKVTA